MIINLIKKTIKKWHHLDKDLNFQLSKKNLSNNQKFHQNQKRFESIQQKLYQHIEKKCSNDTKKRRNHEGVT